MQRKVKVCITIDSEVLETAKEHITYLSRYIETCLRRANSKYQKDNKKIDVGSSSETQFNKEETPEELKEFYSNLVD